MSYFKSTNLFSTTIISSARISAVPPTTEPEFDDIYRIKLLLITIICTNTSITILCTNTRYSWYLSTMSHFKCTNFLFNIFYPLICNNHYTNGIIWNINLSNKKWFIFMELFTNKKDAFVNHYYMELFLLWVNMDATGIATVAAYLILTISYTTVIITLF